MYMIPMHNRPRHSMMTAFDTPFFREFFAEPGKLSMRVDVGASSCFSEIAMTQTLDNLRANGTLDVIQYLERLPERLIPRKAELVEELKKATQTQEAGREAAASGELGAAVQRLGDMTRETALEKEGM